MKILWFTNIPMPAMRGAKDGDHAASGGWMMALLAPLARLPGIEIAVACAAPGLPENHVVTENNIHYHAISQGPAWRLFGLRHPDNNPRHLNACARLVDAWKPDIIHVHGTERLYGLLGARGLVSAPCVLSLQGLLCEYARYRHHFGVTPLKDIIALHDLPHVLRGMGPFFAYAELRRAARREIEILQGNCWFMGRTTWDRAHLRKHNPHARYFHVPEVMRPSFFARTWAYNSCEPHRMLFTNANTFRRGTETLIEALALLKDDFPHARLAIAGGVETQPYGKRLLSRLSRLGLRDSVEFLGRLNESQMVDELCRAHVFAIASLAENSPNSLCEAQLVGLPCVASYAGGIPSLIRHGETGLLFPAGDAAVLAERIRRLFTDVDLARALGAQAREVALSRHEPHKVSESVFAAYEAVISEFSDSRGGTSVAPARGL